MTDFPMTEDVVLLNAAETIRKGMYVEFGLHPSPDGIDPNGRNPFMDFKFGREHGQRFQVTIHLLAEDETTTDAPETPAQTQTALRPPDDECADDLTNQGAATAPPKVKGGERARRAGILCNDPVFQSWYIGNINIAKDSDRVFFTANTLRTQCGIKSRAELDHNEEAARMFDQIVNNFYASQQGRTDPEVARQFAEGPG